MWSFFSCLSLRPSRRHDLDDDLPSALYCAEDPAELVRTIRDSVVGEGAVFPGPFGPRRITYSDYTASGRALSFIEDTIQRDILPHYANTHSESSHVGRQTLRFREDARAAIHRSVGGGPDDLVVACGSGSTAAIRKVIDILGLSKPTTPRTVVFIGPYEHHSNELPWRESAADVVCISLTDDGQIDQADLARRLVEFRDCACIGSFSAGSNVTGLLSDVSTITTLLHRHGALALWDYAACAPYVPINMNPSRSPSSLANLDAIFISPHKFPGGPGTPGILVAKRHLFRNAVPSTPGGGTVDFVTHTSHRYTPDLVAREEGGTPAIVESIRAGLVFQLKDRVGPAHIQRLEHSFARRAIQRWRRHPHLHLLGNLDLPRLSIISFNVLSPSGGVLHHNFVVALLSDLFGIQTRGGCSCAGPYGHRLLSVGDALSSRFAAAIAAGHEGLKPGWVRLNFNFFLSERTFEFVLDAVEFVASYGKRFLPLYRFDPHTGAWTHRDSHPVRRLADLDVGLSPSSSAKQGGERASERVFPRYLAEARRLAEKLDAAPSEEGEWVDPFPPEVRGLRWFVLPGIEGVELTMGGGAGVAGGESEEKVMGEKVDLAKTPSVSEVAHLSYAVAA
ncbi:hypothetical protein JCM10207_001613 [Rhodosporidiobolus poonsookiae]